ncbi:MAG: LysM peptidoglycan-binding domain-containing protein [Caldilineales bacterium]|nr:LysM peptidoglycan-binding domain-containing protein [Caldilineales bacterium]MDW8316757.1 LysM peptidoglycan-binding domain-containing protein [Anaerolineae bacterium]
MKPQLSPDLRPLRYCPRCGQRVAQRAETCFLCGAALETRRPRRLALPVADLLLLAVVLSVAFLWWTRAPQDPDVIAAAGPTPTATATPSPSPTATPAPPTPTPTATPTVTPTPTPIVHTVVRGETVESIAKAYGVSVQDLMAANGLTRDLIRVDQKLIIPAGPIPRGPDGKPLPTNTPTPESAVYKVEVRPGDTLEGLAKKYKTTVDAIVAATDWLTSTDTILIPGDLVIVPVGEAALAVLASPTPAPTATPVPTPTPTPGPRWPAPQPLSPVHETDLGRGPAVLQWLSVGVLAPDEVYVVRVAPVGRLRDELIDVTTATSYRVPTEWLERYAGSGASFLWQVQVARNVRAVAGQVSGLRPVSASSPVRVFRWGATAAPTASPSR